ALSTRIATLDSSSVEGAFLSSGDLALSVKGALELQWLSAGLNLQARIPSKIESNGLALINSALVAMALFTADLHKQHQMPLRLHVNAGYVREGGRTYRAGGSEEEDVVVHSSALAWDVWGYDQVVVGGGLAF